MASLVDFGNRVRPLAGTGFDLLGIPGMHAPLELIEHLNRFDEVLSWAGFNQPLLRERAAAMGPAFHFFPALPGPEDAGHVSDYFFRQTRHWHGLTTEPEHYLAQGGRRFLLRTKHSSDPVPRAKPLVVLHPFSGSAAKNWPLQHFKQLAADLHVVADVCWCASPEDPLPADLARLAWRHEALATLAGQLAATSLYVGNDSGITHLAAMLGIPTVVFFGPMSPTRWHPRGGIVYPVCTPSTGMPASAIPYSAGRLAVLKALPDSMTEAGYKATNTVR